MTARKDAMSPKPDQAAQDPKTPERDLLARHFGARDTRAWRAFLQRHRGLLAEAAEREGEPAPRIGEPEQPAGGWLLLWPNGAQWILGRARGGQAEILGHFVTGSGSALNALLQGHPLASFGASTTARLHACLENLDPAAPVPEILDLQQLAAGADRRRRFAKRPASLAERLGLRYLDEPGLEQLHALAALLQHLQLNQPSELERPSRAAGYGPAPKPWSAGTGAARLQALAAALPESPGVYLLLDEARRVYYVGSSANLRRRVRSYLRARPPYPARLQRLLEPLADVEIHPCGTELAALLEEDRLIRQRRPRGNRVRRVHARHRSLRDQVVLLPHAGGGLELMALRPPCAPLRLHLRRSSLASAARRLQSFYGRARPAAARGAGRREAELVQSWLQRHGDRFARLPATAATRAAGWRQLLGEALEDDQARERPVLRQGRPFDRSSRLD